VNRPIPCNVVRRAWCSLRQLVATADRRPVRRVVGLVTLLALTAFLALSGCSGERPSLAEPAAGDTGAPVDAAKLATLDPRAVDVATVATAVVPTVAVYDEPGAPEPSRTLDNPIASGGPLVFVAEQSTGDWLQVLLPVRPNGSTGWVRAADVTLARHNYRIEVHLSEFRLDVYLQGQIVRQVKIGVAKESTPTPGGRYYTTELIQPPAPDSVYGTLAYGLSGFSDVLESFNGGPGQLGIHGTNDASSIGQQVSSGCIRMRNEDIEDLASFLPLGVPVTVVA
jgi:lipoprotein-anchoring transpeptidase ErfK/SrfK